MLMRHRVFTTSKINAYRLNDILAKTQLLIAWVMPSPDITLATN